MATASGKHVFKAETCVYSTRQKLRRRGNEDARERIITGPLCFLNDIRLLRWGYLFPRKKTFDLGERVKKCVHYGLGSDMWRNWDPKRRGYLPKVTREPVALDSKSAWLEGTPSPQRCLQLYSSGNWDYDRIILPPMWVSKLNKKSYWHQTTQVTFILNFQTCGGIYKHPEF